MEKFNWKENFLKLQEIINKFSELENYEKLIIKVDKIIELIKSTQSLNPSTKAQKNALKNTQIQISDNLSEIYDLHITDSKITEFTKLLSDLVGPFYETILNNFQKEQEINTKLIQFQERAAKFNKEKKITKEQTIEITEKHKKYIKEMNLFITQYDKLSKKILANGALFNASIKANFEHLSSAQNNIKTSNYPSAIDSLNNFKNQKNKEIQIFTNIKDDSIKIKKIYNNLSTFQTEYINKLKELKEHSSISIEDMINKILAYPR